MKKFFKESWAIIGYIIGLIGSIVTIMTVSGKLLIDIKWIIFLGIVLLALTVMTFMSISKLHSVFQNGTRFEVIAYDTEGDQDIYYTNYTNNLRINTIVSIYFLKPLSKKIGVGIVHNTSVDEYIEIRVLHIESEYEKLKKNDTRVLKNMYILPNIYCDEVAKIAEILKGGDL